MSALPHSDQCLPPSLLATSFLAPTLWCSRTRADSTFIHPFQLRSISLSIGTFISRTRSESCLMVTARPTKLSKALSKGLTRYIHGIGACGLV
ncbi:uncharacterized protein SCHCODRAFT_02116741 [Schizophyllum commune H4-8]|uniref:uncharacterized protein n=1 Tax=Schizophyllum commune (strain H4-8 / FGSC 9210) TaxID=578458 RepID=UPI00215F8EEC|nr:uncharacterized protein SCHCODRAFT_02116741 [Schizophyllum commune H4-8]KAI5886228.1 hypothetical protein SCHCODRAFT_02116741 [Schizophyllum commune H4-8]